MSSPPPTSPPCESPQWTVDGLGGAESRAARARTGQRVREQQPARRPGSQRYPGLGTVNSWMWTSYAPYSIPCPHIHNNSQYASLCHESLCGCRCCLFRSQKLSYITQLTQHQLKLMLILFAMLAPFPWILAISHILPKLEQKQRTPRNKTFFEHLTLVQLLNQKRVVSRMITFTIWPGWATSVLAAIH